MSKTREISIKWCFEDVLEVRPDLTEDQCGDVLDYLKRHHDATLGINWDTIRCVAEDMFPEPQMEE